MDTILSPRRRRGARLVALALGGIALAPSGCIPVGWLPDSSGFVYTRGKEFDRLVHYDLATGRSRVLVEKMPARTSAVGVSPDGKRIAVARLRGAGKGRTETMQVLLYDLQGKLAHRSPEFDWGPSRRSGRNEFPNTGVFWGPQADVLLVQDYEDQGRTGIYDLRKDAMRHVLEGSPCAYGGTPVRPDGKGFLIVRGVPPSVPEPEVFLVDWAGKAEPVRVKWGIKDPETALGLLHSPWRGTSGWDGPVARVTSGRVGIQIDTEKRTGTIHERRREDAAVDGKELVQYFAFPRGGIRLRVLVVGRTKSTDPGRDEDVHLRLEMIRPGRESRLLREFENGSCLFSPSPDGKWVAVRSGSDTTRPDDVLLVSETGEVREVTGERKD